MACLTEKQSDFSSERADICTTNYTNPELRPEKSWLAGDVTVVSHVDQNGDFKAKAIDVAAKAKIAKYTKDRYFYLHDLRFNFIWLYRLMRSH